jgi:hypothetical protein
MEQAMAQSNGSGQRREAVATGLAKVKRGARLVRLAHNLLLAFGDAFVRLPGNPLAHCSATAVGGTSKASQRYPVQSTTREPAS